MFPTKNDTPDAARAASVSLLNQHLALATSAQLFSKAAHWNVKGEGFYPAHKLFDKVYELVQGQTDDIAERITALGGEALGLPAQIEDAWKKNRATAMTGIAINASMGVQDNVRAMAAMLASVANSYRAAIGETSNDPVTQNLYLRLAEDTDHMLYFLEANLRA